MDEFMKEAIANAGTSRDRPLRFTISNDDDVPLVSGLIQMALRMAEVGLARAALDMAGTVTMRFEPRAITFVYMPEARAPATSEAAQHDSQE